MKTDRELLELAARAAGYVIEIDYYGQHRHGLFNTEKVVPPKLWNPLTDDGDALRLAVKLNMQIVITGKSDSLDVGITDARSTESGWEKAIHIKCPYGATRRAIVRAAAEVGKGMLSHYEFVFMFPERFDEEEVARAKDAIGETL